MSIRVSFVVSDPTADQPSFLRSPGGRVGRGSRRGRGVCGLWSVVCVSMHLRSVCLVCGVWLACVVCLACGLCPAVLFKAVSILFNIVSNSVNSFSSYSVLYIFN